MSRILVLLVAFFIAAPSFAAVNLYQFDDPAQEARYKKLIAELRCLVCQNQNLADSDAELAQDLRGKTYNMIRDGKTDAEIIDYMVQRYGDFVLYRPPLKSSTALLWIGPFIIFGVGVVVLINVIRRRRKMVTVNVEEDQLAKARQLLEQEDKSA